MVKNSGLFHTPNEIINFIAPKIKFARTDTKFNQTWETNSKQTKDRISLDRVMIKITK